jgi:hypothetical protein
LTLRCAGSICASDALVSSVRPAAVLTLGITPEVNEWQDGDGHNSTGLLPHVQYQPDDHRHTRQPPPDGRESTPNGIRYPLGPGHDRRRRCSPA